MRPNVIARRIKEARELCSLTQQELALLMGWKSHASLVAIEKGEQEVKTWELLKFADIFKVPPESLYREESEVPPRPLILWRKKSGSGAAVLHEELLAIQHCRDYRLIERLVGVSPAATKQLPREECDIQSVEVDWANSLADKVHRELRLGDYPAELLAKCLEEDYGVLLMYRPLENGSAACCREDVGSAIVLNEKEVPWRQVFNLAHELFHLITWSSLLIEKIQQDEGLFNKNERLAEAFAAALLMPQQMIDLDVRGQKLTYSLIVALARKYRVSAPAIVWRLRHLRFISSDAVKNVLSDKDFIQLNRSTFKEALETAPPVSNRFLRLAYLAYENGRLSKGRLAQMLGVNLRDVESYLSEKGLYLTNDKEIETGSA